jgi:hypothetical protein
MESGNFMSRMDIGYEWGNQQNCIGYHEELRWWNTSTIHDVMYKYIMPYYIELVRIETTIWTNKGILIN